MGSSSSTPEKSSLATNPINVDVTKQYGSGAEQDRYGDHFSKVGEKAGEKIREGFQDLKATTTTGSGAEQDRYGQRFGAGGAGSQQAADTARQGFQQAKVGAEDGYARAKVAAKDGYNKAKNVAEDGYDKARDAAHEGYDKARDVAGDGYERAREAFERAINAKGNGAEQDSYGSHFDYSSLDLKPVTRAALSILGHGGNLDAASAHGLGHDGWQRAKYLAMKKGNGAEQDRYAAHFGGIGERAGQAIKDKVNELRK